MSIPEKPQKAFVSVREMAEMVSLSKSRFHALTQAGIFPRPVRHEACKRPVYDLDTQQKCLDIRRTGVGANGQPVLFNRKRKATSRKPEKIKQPEANDHADLIEALKSLGLSASNESVSTSLTELFPDGHDGLDQGEVVRQLFLHLQQKS